MAPHGFLAVGRDGAVAGHAPVKTKRKELEGVYDEFLRFSLSAPARKIRRLDAELFPIVEEVELVPRVPGQSLTEEQLQRGLMDDGLAELEGEPPLTWNEERAIVPYNPQPSADLPISTAFIKVDPDVIAGFKNGRLWSDNFNMVDVGDQEREPSGDGGRAASNGRLAMVPWVPSPPSGAAFATKVRAETSEVKEETMPSEDVDAVSMDVDVEAGQPGGVAAPCTVVPQGLPHWQQRCLTPQISTGSPSTITWAWR